MSKKKYILNDKTRKDLCCSVPRMLSEYKTASALKVIEKYNEFTNSPVFLSYSIAVAESSQDKEEVDRLYGLSISALKQALKESDNEVTDYFVYLFSFYLGLNDFDKAKKIYEMGTDFGVDKKKYGMLWVSYYDKINDTQSGIDSLKQYLVNKKKLKPNEIEFLKRKYPNISSSNDFNNLF